MKNNVLIIYATFPITIISFIVSINSSGICYDIALAVFGSSLLTLILGIIGYNTERKRVLENFYLVVRKRIKFWDLYDRNEKIQSKCRYFIDYYLKDFEDLGTAYADIFFIFNRFSKKQKCIYEKIYNRCMKFSWLIEEHYWNFKWYIDGSGKNDQVIAEFINKIEDEMLNVIKSDSGEYSEPKITRELDEELSKNYYEIMYGKRKYQKW